MVGKETKTCVILHPNMSSTNDLKQETIDTYERTAAAMADKFNAIGVRKEEIDEIFHLIKKDQPTVLEIGCANGRDAAEIVTRTSRYTGIDVSPAFIEMARAYVPTGTFEVADVETY